MSIIIGIAIMAAAVTIRLRYRPRGEAATLLFLGSILVGLITVFTAGSFSSVVLAVLMLVQVALCALMLLLYRVETERQLEAERRRAVETRLAHERAAAAAKQRARESFFAFAANDAA